MLALRREERDRAVAWVVQPGLGAVVAQGTGNLLTWLLVIAVIPGALFQPWLLVVALPLSVPLGRVVLERHRVRSQWLVFFLPLTRTFEVQDSPGTWRRVSRSWITYRDDRGDHGPVIGSTDTAALATWLNEQMERLRAPVEVV